MSDQNLASQIEALLLVSTEPVLEATIAQLCQADSELVHETLQELADFYTETNRGFQLRQLAGGWQLATRAEHGELITKWVVEGQQNKLSQAALETLAVIAYAQPISRSRVSAVRGVNVDGVVRTLIARGLVTELGQDEQSGAGLLGTTDYFLARIGLNSLDELPPIAPHLPDASELEAELSRLADKADQEGVPSVKVHDSMTEAEKEEDNG